MFKRGDKVVFKADHPILDIKAGDIGEIIFEYGNTGIYSIIVDRNAEQVNATNSFIKHLSKAQTIYNNTYKRIGEQLEIRFYEKQCECGAESTSNTNCHSYWCPKYKKVM